LAWKNTASPGSSSHGSLEDGAHAGGIGDVLALAGNGHVINAAEQMRSLHHLQAAVRAGGAVECDLAAREMWEDAAVVVPVAVVLMPLPGATDERLLRGELGLEVIDRAAEQRLHGVDHAGAAGRHAVDGIAGAVSQRDARRRTLRVEPIQQVVPYFGVLFHRSSQQAGLVRVEHGADDDEAVGVEAREVRGREK
jgi:hypothetical protein